MNELKYLLHELRCDIAAIPVTEDNKTEIDNTNETLQRAWDKVLFLSGVSNAKRTFCFNCKHDEIGEDMICVECKEGDKFKAK